MNIPARAKNETGNRYGRLLVIEFAAIDKWGKAMWRCVCDCGTTKIASAVRLRNGACTSCGCFQREGVAARVATHRRSLSKIYNIWRGIVKRITLVTDRAYHKYGGRGIGIDARWLVFANFYADMGDPPFPGASIDRIDNDSPLGYCKANCRWATMREQGNNTRVNHRVTAFGRTQTVAEWARERGLKPGTIYRRLKRGWSDEDALSLEFGPTQWDRTRMGHPVSTVSVPSPM